MNEKVFVGDVGTLIRIDMQESLTSLASYALHVRKPDKTTVSWSGVGLVKNGDYLEYTILSGDLNVAGDYLIQPYGTIGAWTGHGDTVRLIVDEQFQ
jgi:hypothetical protein